MTQNKFIITSPAYKVSKWIEMYVSILKHQSYTNFEVYFIDDNSPDNTFEKLSELTKDDSRFHIFKNEENIGSPLANIVKAFDLANPDDDDIIVNIDGDDWLSSVFTLQYLNDVYNHYKCWMTYGSCQIFPSGEVTGHSNIPMPDEVSDKNIYKQYPFISTHLRSYKAGLFKKIDRKDLTDYRRGKLYKEAGDLALMFPMLEMAGKEKSHRVEDILYILNRENELNEAKINFDKQKETEHIIRTQQKVYERIHNL
jgi:glycosyltransferase involved in cell wall biosynthesis